MRLFAWLLVPCLLRAVGVHAGFENRFVSTGGMRLQYIDWGGAGETILFIPGGCETASVFGDIAGGLATRFRVLGLTARGCGESDRPAAGYGMNQQVGDIAGFMDALGIASVTLIGHSSGGGKITQFARKHPARVHRLVYLDTVFRYVAPGLEEKIGAAIAKESAWRADGLPGPLEAHQPNVGTRGMVAGDGSPGT